MKAINQFEFYQLGMYLHPLEKIEGDALMKDWWYELWSAGNWLDYLMTNQLVGLVVSNQAALKLLNQIRQLAPKDLTKGLPDLEKSVEESSPSFAYYLKQNLQQFETVFAAELHVTPSYSVRRKGIYQTDMLVDHAEQAFSDSARKAIPDGATKDFREAGRCLAFELPTAAAFHVMRATEAVLRRYHALQTSLSADKKSPEMAVCINEIKTAGGNAKVTVILDQIRDLHRNPTMHPEDFLNIDEALSVFDVAKSAIAAMAAEIVLLELNPPAPKLSK